MASPLVVLYDGLGHQGGATPSRNGVVSGLRYGLALTLNAGGRDEVSEG
jgi:hypothetical protein